MVTPQVDEQDYSISGSDEPGAVGLDEEDLGLPDDDYNEPDDQPGYDPAFDDQLAQRDAQITQRERAFVEAARVVQFRQKIQAEYDTQYQQLYQVFTQRGYPEDEAKALADGVAFPIAQGKVHAFDAHWNRVQKVAMQEGVAEEVIANEPNELAMRQRAQYFKASGGPETARVQQLEQKVAQQDQMIRQMLGGRTPKYNQPGSGGRGSSGSYVARLKSGKPLPSAREIDRITSRYLRG